VVHSYRHIISKFQWIGIKVLTYTPVTVDPAKPRSQLTALGRGQLNFPYITSAIPAQSLPQLPESVP
jgi:hypothetical protein